jgi:hypothetical protein
LAGTREFTSKDVCSKHTAGLAPFPLLSLGLQSKFSQRDFIGIMIKLFFTVKALLGLLLSPIPAPEIWAEPVPYFFDKQLGNFVAPLSERGAGHRGIDVVVDDEPLHSPVSGVVTFNGLVVNRQVLTIRNGGRQISFEPICSELEVGEVIASGELLGKACAGQGDYTQHCGGCIHFSVRTSRGYLNPLLFFGKLRPSEVIG